MALRYFIDWIVKRLAFIFLVLMMVLITLTGALGAHIIPEVDRVFVNLATDSSVSFEVFYMNDAGSALNAVDKRAEIMDHDGTVLKSLNLLNVDTGEFLFNADVSSFEPGDYTIRIFVDGNSRDVPLRIGNISPAFSVFYHDGVLNVGRIFGALGLLFLIAIGLIFFILTDYKKGARKNG